MNVPACDGTSAGAPRVWLVMSCIATEVRRQWGEIARLIWRSAERGLEPEPAEECGLRRPQPCSVLLAACPPMPSALAAMPTARVSARWRSAGSDEK